MESPPEGLPPDLQGLGLNFGFTHLGIAVPLDMLKRIFAEVYEAFEVMTLEALYKKTDRVLEAGAGLGMVTCLLSRLSGFVCALEPIPEYYRLTTFNVRGNECGGNVLMMNAALGPDEGEVEYHERMLPYASSLYGDGVSHDPVRTSYRVPCTTINEMVKRHNLNALHLDIEGAEAALLPSVDWTPINKIGIEIHSALYGSEKARDVLRVLETNGLDEGMIMPWRNYPGENYSLSLMRADQRPGFFKKDVTWPKPMEHIRIRDGELERWT
jgi:FkbM family methyltransferase